MLNLPEVEFGLRFKGPGHAPVNIVCLVRDALAYFFQGLFYLLPAPVHMENRAENLGLVFLVINGASGCVRQGLDIRAVIGAVKVLAQRRHIHLERDK